MPHPTVFVFSRTPLCGLAVQAYRINGLPVAPHRCAANAGKSYDARQGTHAVLRAKQRGKVVSGGTLCLT